MYKSSIPIIQGIIMPSKHRIVGYLDEADFKIYQLAQERYGLGKSKFLKEIVHAWLFDHRLQLQEKVKKDV
jgi:hypothetical protein